MSFRVKICANRAGLEWHIFPSLIGQKQSFVPVMIICIYITNSPPEEVLCTDVANRHHRRCNAPDNSQRSFNEHERRHRSVTGQLIMAGSLSASI